ncbi:unnamed protein product [Victoria cruziana]
MDLLFTEAPRRPIAQGDVLRLEHVHSENLPGQSLQPPLPELLPLQPTGCQLRQVVQAAADSDAMIAGQLADIAVDSDTDEIDGGIGKKADEATVIIGGHVEELDYEALWADAELDKSNLVGPAPDEIRPPLAVEADDKPFPVGPRLHISHPPVDDQGIAGHCGVDGPAADCDPPCGGE